MICFAITKYRIRYSLYAISIYWRHIAHAHSEPYTVYRSRELYKSTYSASHCVTSSLLPYAVTVHFHASFSSSLHYLCKTYLNQSISQNKTRTSLMVCNQQRIYIPSVPLDSLVLHALNVSCSGFGAWIMQYTICTGFHISIHWNRRVGLFCFYKLYAIFDLQVLYLPIWRVLIKVPREVWINMFLKKLVGVWWIYSFCYRSTPATASMWICKKP